MISKNDLDEIRNRDFLKKVNHYRDKDNIKTNLIFGEIAKNKIFLTVIIPVYNHPIEFIKRAINSALNQNCSYSYQILVIDDYAQEKGATETERYLRMLNDSRIVYLKNEENLGVFANWNRAIEMSNSEWVTILHTDDFYKNNFLKNMCYIVDQYPQIDQLACNYKMLNFLNDEINIENEMVGQAGKRHVRKVDYIEYMYDMVTSVKGAFYKKSKIIDLGGFRSQGDGIGLDDYPLMMRFAHYYNTYLLEDVLYLNSWGYNDSLNTKHWYPELVENYYMWIYFAKKEKKIAQYIYRQRANSLLYYRAKQYKNGTSWVGVPIDINFEQLKQDCQINKFNTSVLKKKLTGVLVKVLNAWKVKHKASFLVDIEEA